MSHTSTTGIIEGTTITLDAPIPALDGKRVRVTVENVEAVDAVLEADEHAQLWKQWAANGPDGPIEQDEGPDFP